MSSSSLLLPRKQALQLLSEERGRSPSKPLDPSLISKWCADLGFELGLQEFDDTRWLSSGYEPALRQRWQQKRTPRKDEESPMVSITELMKYGSRRKIEAIAAELGYPKADEYPEAVLEEIQRRTSGKRNSVSAKAHIRSRDLKPPLMPKKICNMCSKPLKTGPQGYWWPWTP